MKLRTSLLVGLFSLVSASTEAQSPSTTQVGILKTTNPYAVSILLNQTWYPMGSVNTSLNLWTLPVAQVVSGTTPILAATNTWTDIQTFSAPIYVGSSNPIAITNLGALASYNFNLPTSAGSANAPLLSGGGGSSAMTWGTRSGVTTKFATVSGSFTVGNCVNTDANGDFHDAGAPCGSG